MKEDNIIKIEIDEVGRLLIKPAKERFIMIYRSATEVHWDQIKNSLYSPKPREWTYLDWYKHILFVVKDEYGFSLKLTNKTVWINVPELLKAQIIETKIN